MAVLIGSTGFVGGHLARQRSFPLGISRANAHLLEGCRTELLVCAGLPAEKWRANRDPGADWANMATLASALSTARADRAVLISTIDVYQPAVGVDETSPATYSGAGAYGVHRAWFEAFFRSQFPDALIVRLPALFAPDLRKNLVFDLLHGRTDQLASVRPESTFQFFDVTGIWEVIEQAWTLDLRLLNVSSEPVSAQQVADLFAVQLTADSAATPSRYDMRSLHAEAWGGRDGYLYGAEAALAGIAELRAGEDAP